MYWNYQIPGAHVSIRLVNWAGVKHSASVNCSKLSVNHANRSPMIFDFMAWPSLILVRLLYLKWGTITLKRNLNGKNSTTTNYLLAFLATCLVFRLFGCFNFVISLSKLVGGCQCKQKRNVHLLTILNIISSQLSSRSLTIFSAVAPNFKLISITKTINIKEGAVSMK